MSSREEATNRNIIHLNSSQKFIQVELIQHTVESPGLPASPVIRREVEGFVGPVNRGSIVDSTSPEIAQEGIFAALELAMEIRAALDH